MEVWVYPFKILHDLHLTFKLGDEDFPEGLSKFEELIIVRPESTTLVYSHPAFTVREMGVWTFNIMAEGFHNYIVDVSLSALKKNPSLTFESKRITTGVELTGPVVEKELFDRAKDLYDNKDYKGASSNFKSYLRIPPVYHIYYSIGHYHQELQ